MSKQKKPSQPTFSATRNFKLTHQSLTINDINFKTKTITVSVVIKYFSRSWTLLYPPHRVTLSCRSFL